MSKIEYKQYKLICIYSALIHAIYVSCHVPLSETANCFLPSGCKSLLIRVSAKNLKCLKMLTITLPFIFQSPNSLQQVQVHVWRIVSNKANSICAWIIWIIKSCNIFSLTGVRKQSIYCIDLTWLVWWRLKKNQQEVVCKSFSNYLKNAKVNLKKTKKTHIHTKTLLFFYPDPLVFAQFVIVMNYSSMARRTKNKINHDSKSDDTNAPSL